VQGGDTEMILDIEITLNRFGFFRISPNKVQVASLRLSLWDNPHKHALCCEVNWARDKP